LQRRFDLGFCFFSGFKFYRFLNFLGSNLAPVLISSNFLIKVVLTAVFIYFFFVIFLKFIYFFY
jgi:hypothetical protein